LPVAATGVKSDENIDAGLPNSCVVMPELVVSCCTCTGKVRVELRRPPSDGVVDAIDIGVLKSIEFRLLLGQMLAGVTRPKGVGAAIGV